MTNTKKNNKTKKETCSAPIPLVEYKDLMTAKEVCELLHISIHTLYKWVEKKTIPYYKLTESKLLFNRRKLSNWLESKMVA